MPRSGAGREAARTRHRGDLQAMAGPTPIQSLDKIPAFAFLAIQSVHDLLARQRANVAGSRLGVLRRTPI